MPIRLLVLSLVFITLSSCSGEWRDYPMSESQGTQKNTKALIQTGDTVNVTVFGEDTLSGRYEVAEDGSIPFALIGSLIINNKTSDQAADFIAETLKQKGYLINPKVTVALDQSRSFSVIGEVAGSGEFTFKPGMTVLDAVALAGGFSYRANQNDFDIIRKTDGQPDQVLKGVISTRIQPGDVVRVRERYF